MTYKQHRLDKRWNYNLAEDEWFLTGKREYEPFATDFLKDCDKDGLVRVEIGCGDRAWAERTAKKFNIDLEEKK